ncbi:5-carboxymethyl-2-hydroxymuconate Delta-isomerase [Undibacterium sp. Ji49W]|uniref:5-carboxymethyl-2-hydroxymuconate Delta-isomerase n=1 Tax=Undibacterium sp. Ji49W TaxID=3413040 RepID=UPI003BF3941E
MPHLTVEYSANLPIQTRELLLEINTALVATNHFKEIDIKSRAIRFDTYVIGTANAERAFLHAKLVILTGRTIEVKRELSELVLAIISKHGPRPAGLDVQLCVEIQELERETYAKAHFSADN